MTKKAVKEKKSMLLPVIAGASALALAGFGVVALWPEKKSEPSAVVKEQSFREKWKDCLLETPVMHTELEKSPTFVKFKESGLKKNYKPAIDSFIKNQAPENYSLESMAGIGFISGYSCAFAISTSGKYVSKQKNLEAITKLADGLKAKPEDDVFKESIKLAYFLTRSNFRSGTGVDAFDPDLESRMKEGQLDCDIMSNMYAANFLHLAKAAGRQKLIENLRIAYGLEKHGVQRKMLHAWIEYYDGKWNVLEMNHLNDDWIYNTEYSQKIDYLKLAANVPYEDYVPMSATVFSLKNKEKWVGAVKILAVPKNIKAEMIQNEWK